MRRALISLVALAMAAYPATATAHKHHHHRKHHHHVAAAHAYPIMGVHDGSPGYCASNARPTKRTWILTPDYAAAGDSMNDPHWTQLRSTIVRYSPLWDVALPHDLTTAQGRQLEVQQLCLDAWLAEAAAHHQTVELALRPDPNYVDATHTRMLIPDAFTYGVAMRALISAYTYCGPCSMPAVPSGFAPFPATMRTMARVTVYASWGEPNFGGKARVGAYGVVNTTIMPQGGRPFADANCGPHPTVNDCGPLLAVAMWVTVHRDCPSCVNLAGDFSSNAGYNMEGGPKTYLREMADAFKRQG